MELPKQQVGIGTDDCHPRFVACLLRLGDLLDLDDNRFCPVMMKMAGDLPDMSKAHHDKHLAIRHFRADPDRIEIEADCPSYESYIETTKWFGWLREEVKNQMSCWFDIVPKRNFGLLPSVGDLKAHLKDWQVFNENERPQFTLDRDRIFELLQGAGLYENKEQAMRELLQNAVDATLIRIWREHGEDCNPQPKLYLTRNSAPRSEDTLKTLNNYAIDVSIEKIKEEGQYNYWRVMTTDQGTGISREDLKFMLQMGSSKRNFKKQEIIEQMPMWMTPSGIFGIGLHSAFLLTDEVWMETRSIDAGETLLIRLTNPTSDKEHGNAYFRVITESTEIDLYHPCENEKKRTINPWDFSRYGCQLSFIYQTDKKAELKNCHDNVHQALKTYDGLINLTRDFEIINLSSAVSDFFKNNFLSGNLKFDGKDESFSREDISDLKSSAYFYAPNQKLELINITLSAPEHLFNSIQFYYRGQKVNDSSIHFNLNLVSVSINLLNNRADEILTINRNKFKNSEYNTKCLITSIIETINEFFNCPAGKEYYDNQTDEAKVILSAEFKSHEWKQPNYFYDWRQLLIKPENKFLKIEDLKYYEIVLGFNERGDENKSTYTQQLIQVLDKEEQGKCIRIARDINWEYFRLVSQFLKEQSFKATYVIKADVEIVKITKELQEPISNEVIHEYCKKILLGEKRYEAYLKRQSIPCLSCYNSLELKDPGFLTILENEDYAHYIDTGFSLDRISPRMLFPLAVIDEKITVGNPDILVERVYKSRKDTNVTQSEISKKYQEFIAFLDKLMQDDEEWKEKRGDEFKPAE